MNESMRSVTIARKIDRPSAKQFINEMFDDFLIACLGMMVRSLVELPV